ncbi:M17 family metallopeptidase [Mycoplasma sp. 3341]|uniref:M17 family metallopeptidase n=1 Tax=Mycoplasma sp. 3341 TaxID=3447506 RepID=UPI003F65748B
MIKLINEKNDALVLKAAFEESKLPEVVLKKDNVVTDLFNKNTSYVYLGKKEEFGAEKFESFIKAFTANLKRSYQLDVATFTSAKLSASEVVKLAVEAYEFNQPIYNLKTKKDDKKDELDFYLLSKRDLSAEFEESSKVASVVRWARNLQQMAPNYATSEYLAKAYDEELSKYKNLHVKVLNRKQIEDQKMGLFLSVNRGSVYEPRLVVVEYKGNPDSDQVLGLVGKGIAFDSGGYSLKPSRYMLGMKYDMSGSAAVAAAMMLISYYKPKANVVAVMPLTDNRINGDASLPDSVWTSMNGKTVEINNTDAEGRLVLADGMTYAIRNLKATKVATVATLTGAILVGLGTTYTGVWASNDKDWKAIEKSAKTTNELMWRMPLHEDFAKNIRSSKVADLKNTDLSGNGGSISAAMFLKEFAEKADFMHFDIAGTNELSEMPQGVAIKTLAELAKNL